MTTLNINFYAEGITEEARVEFNSAIAHENALMNIQMLNDSISKLDKKIENKNGDYSEEEVASFKAQKDKLEKSRDKFEEVSNDTLEVYTKVVDTMALKNENHFGNDKDVVRTVLRVLASWDNSKLVKYAIIPAFESKELYDCLETIHVNSKCGENGELSMTKEVKEAYKKATDELDRIMKVTFSLPFATPYTDKMRIKLDAEDRNLLHKCYVKGFTNKYTVNEESGTVEFSKRIINTLVKATKCKDGTMKYNYSGLASTISNIVIKHYFK